MWPYATRGSRFMGDVSEISPSALEAEDFSTNAVSIKLWLPEKLVAAIDVLCDQHDASRPDVLRWILFEHVFGRVELAHLKRRMSTQLREMEKIEIMRSARRAPPKKGRHPARSTPATWARPLRISSSSCPRGSSSSCRTWPTPQSSRSPITFARCSPVTCSANASSASGRQRSPRPTPRRPGTSRTSSSRASAWPPTRARPSAVCGEFLPQARPAR